MTTAIHRRKPKAPADESDATPIIPPELLPTAETEDRTPTDLDLEPQDPDAEPIVLETTGEMTAIQAKDDTPPFPSTMISAENRPHSALVSKPETQQSDNTSTGSGHQRSNKRGPLSGAEWPDYLIGNLLGQGGMAAVYLATKRANNQRVALKVLPSRYAHDPSFKKRFELEASMGAKIDSPHVVRVRGKGEYCDTFYIEMEYVDGCSLADTIKNHEQAEESFSTVEIIESATQIATGLDAAEQAHIVHRDIKPGNVLQTRSGVLKISDFGIVKVLGEETLTMTGIALGTPSYMSPEQGRAGEVDNRSDIYSLGVILYHMAAMRVPFDGKTSDAVLYQHHFAEPALLTSLRPDCSEHLQAVIFKCLHKKPEKRYQHASELLEDLHNLSDAQAPKHAVFPGGRINTGAKEALAEKAGFKRHLSWVAGISAAAMLLLACSWWWWSARQDQIGQLRQELSILSQPAPIPHEAPELLKKLQTLVSANDEQVKQWQHKLERVSDTRRDMHALTAKPIANAKDLQRMRFHIGVHGRDIGTDAPLIKQWTQRLNEQLHIQATLQKDMTVLDHQKIIPASLLELLQPSLAELERRLGSDHADILRWQDIITNHRQDIATYSKQLADARQQDKLQAQDVTRLERICKDLGRRVDAKHPQLVYWTQRFHDWHEHTNQLLQRLQILDKGTHVTDHTAGAIQKELQEFIYRFGQDDPRVQRWQERINHSVRQREQAQTQLERYPAKTLLPASVIPTQHEALRVYQAIASTDAFSNAHSKQILDSQARIATLRSLLSDLDKRDEWTAEAQQLVRTHIDEAFKLQAIDKERLSHFQSRLSDLAAVTLSLASNLKDFDKVILPTEEQFKKLHSYERLVGDHDESAQRWRQKADAILQLRERLAVLDRQQTPPTSSADWLKHYAQLVGRTDADYRRWHNRLTAIVDLKARLHGLDKQRAPAFDTEANLADLLKLIGHEDKDLRRWQAKWKRINLLRQSLNALPHSLTLPDDAEAHYDELTRLIGSDDIQMISWGERLRILRGPPQPNWAQAMTRDAYGLQASCTIAGCKLFFRYIPAGSFQMGSAGNDQDADTDEQSYAAELTRSFWLAERETQQLLYQTISQANPAYHRGDRHPVERVSWHDAQACISRIRRMHSNLPLRLPTEAEWEYACRAQSGRQEPADAMQVDLARRATYADNSAGRTAEGGQRLPNALGLFDMQGNVWEWCEDAYAPYPVQASVNPFTGSGKKKVIRGGSWGDKAHSLRPTNRQALKPDTKSAYVGFRLAIDCTISAQPEHVPE